jgi:type III restriction enzyme
LSLVERETLSALGDWDLLAEPVQLKGFAIVETIHSFEIDVAGERVKFRATDARQLLLNEATTAIGETELLRWLDGEVRQPDVPQAQMLAYLVRTLRHLTGDGGMSLTALARAQFQLAQALKLEIARLRGIAAARGFQLRLPQMRVPDLHELAEFAFRFQPGAYPARQCYRGGWEFAKHFYPEIHDLREKTASGKDAEEFLCARAIDLHPKVRRWESASAGRCLFRFAVAHDSAGRSVDRQIADKFAGLDPVGGP